MEKERYERLERNQKKFSFMNKTLEVYIDDNYIYEI